VIGTSTQPNALNQDLCGPDGATTSALTWAALGAVSFPSPRRPSRQGSRPPRSRWLPSSRCVGAARSASGGQRASGACHATVR
jgi:hypothetical protein